MELKSVNYRVQENNLYFIKKEKKTQMWPVSQVLLLHSDRSRNS